MSCLGRRRRVIMELKHVGRQHDDGTATNTMSQ